MNLTALCTLKKKKELFLGGKEIHLEEETASAPPPTVDGLQGPFAIVIRRQTEGERRGVVSRVLVLSHHHGGAQLALPLADQQLAGGQRGLVIVQVLDLEDDGPRARLGG